MSETAPVARLRDHMQTELVTLSAGMEIIRTVNILLEEGVSGACVLDEAGGLVGVLSKRDCLKAALSAAYYKEWGGVVGDLMTPDPKVLEAGLDLVSAAEIFVNSPFRRFPVVEGGRLVGQISRTDVLRALAAQWR